MVGVTGFEPATHCSQSSCATKLRYTPAHMILTLKDLFVNINIFSLIMVGVAGFEPAAHWSQTSCATKLRYSPLDFSIKRKMGWLMGFEPTTTGITIQGSTN